jgi:acetyltransferase-like isoleucine patch superfamily enzyme
MMEKIHNTYRRIRDKVFTLLYRSSFKKLASKSTLAMPFSVEGARFISIEKEVYIKPNAWLLAINDADYSSSETKLSIGEKTYIGRNAHIVALQSIQIEKSVLMGDNVYIADNFHRFERGEVPYKDQGVGFKSEVIIGEGTWLGENVCVISSKIGKQCIVGANSVVLHDIPDYSMAVGSPAKVIKTYNHESKKWVKIKS